MARASAGDLDQIEDVLAVLRALPGVTEKKRGVFYCGHQAFVHFHNDDGIVVADARLKSGEDFARPDVSTKAARAAFVKSIKKI